MVQTMKTFPDGEDDVGDSGEEDERVVTGHEARGHDGQPIGHSGQQQVEEPHDVGTLLDAGLVRLPNLPLQFRHQLMVTRARQTTHDDGEGDDDGGNDDTMWAHCLTLAWSDCHFRHFSSDISSW